MNPLKQDAANAIGKWNPVIETEEGELQLYIDGEKIDPSREDLDAIAEKTLELEAKAKANEYKHLRAKEYAQLNQYELMFDDLENGTTLWPDAVNAIKLKYPKPG